MLVIPAVDWPGGCPDLECQDSSQFLFVLLHVAFFLSWRYLAPVFAYHYSLLMIYSAQLALMSGFFEKPEIKLVVNA